MSEKIEKIALSARRNQQQSPQPPLYKQDIEQTKAVENDDAAVKESRQRLESFEHARQTADAVAKKIIAAPDLARELHKLSNDSLMLLY